MREIEKTGRNEPCPCGSGKKFKKCCLDSQENEVSYDRTPENFDPSKFKLEMESMLRKMSKIAEKKDMSVEDLNGYFTGKHMDDIDEEYSEVSESTPKELALDLVYDAMEMHNENTREKLAKAALKLYPHLPDALIILAEGAQSQTEALEFYQQAVNAGEHDLGNDFFKENEGHFWMMTETRPYMRAKVFLAQTLWEMGNEDECIQHYWECIRLNPNDNQGIRDPLFTCLLIKNDFDAIETLIKKYPEDFGASSSFNRALYLFKKYGPDSKRALKQLQKAIEFNRFVPPYLLKKRKLPRNTPDSYAYKSEEEAIIYGEESMRAWAETPEALLWLERVTSLQ